MLFTNQKECVDLYMSGLFTLLVFGLGINFLLINNCFVSMC